MRPRIKKHEVQNKEKSQHLKNGTSDDNTPFQTPDRENATDYGLEFTTSRLAELNTSPRRCSTLRKNFSKSHQDMSTSENSTDENHPPKSTPKRAPSYRRPQQASAEPKKSTSNQRVRSTQQQTPTTRAASRRKQNKPEHRIKRLNREIVRLQKLDSFMIPRLPFSRLVREIMMEHSITPFMISGGALEAIQTATEMYLTQRFQDAYLLTQYRSRVTLEVRDMAMVAYFCKTYGNF